MITENKFLISCVHGLIKCCGSSSHNWGPWEKQRLFAFEERECKCCSHIESRMLPEGEEEV